MATSVRRAAPYQTGLLALTAIAAASRPAAATPATLRTGTGDGYLQLTVDEYGTLGGCSPTGDGVFDPIGPTPSEGTVCRLALQIFDQAKTIKQMLSGPYP